MLMCLMLALIPPIAAYAMTYHWVYYVDGGAVPGGIPYHTNGYSPRQENRVWRPIGYLFAVWYIETPHGQIFDSGNNPIIDPRNSSYGMAFCENYSGVVVEPTTCRTTTPN